MLDLTPFNNAISQLEIAYQRSVSAPDDEIVRDGVIKRFEYTYESAIKFLKRYLALSEAEADDIYALSLSDIIRLGSDRKLLMSDWVVWERFRRDRNVTSHTYDKAKASEVFMDIPDFMKEVRFLLQRLEEKSNA